jgi:hypothetical protein
MNMVARPSQERGRKKRMIMEEIQEWTDRDSWRLLYKSQPTKVETT